MKEVFNILNQKEKTILKIVFVLLILAFFFLFFIAMRERNTYSRSLSSLSSKEREHKNLNLKKMEKEREWLSWRKARQDIKELKANYFYNEGEDKNQLRLDLQKLFDESNIRVSQIRYTYTEFEKDKVRKVVISFNVVGSYYSLKGFIDSVEKFSRLLAVEKIDFLETSSKGSSLKLKMTLAGYYAL